MLRDWLQHAFSVEAAGPAEPTEAQRLLLDRLCRQIVARDLTTPSLIFLETVRPLNFVTGQCLRFFAPILESLGDSRACEVLAGFLEQRGSIDWLCRRIEELDRERASESRQD